MTSTFRRPPGSSGNASQMGSGSLLRRLCPLVSADVIRRQHQGGDNPAGRPTGNQISLFRPVSVLGCSWSPDLQRHAIPCHSPREDREPTTTPPWVGALFDRCLGDSFWGILVLGELA